MKNKNEIGLKDAIAIGNGGIVGGGIFALVNLANYRLASKTHSKKYIAILGFSLCIIALMTLIWQQFNSNRIGVYTVTDIFLIAYLLEWIYKKKEHNKSHS